MGCSQDVCSGGPDDVTRGGGMRRTTPSTYAVGLALTAVLAVAGCTNNPTPTPGGSSTPPAASTTSASTTSSTTPTATSATSTTTAGDPNIPPAARAKTADGAVAFTSYFLTQANAAYKQLKPELLSPLVRPACKTCSAMTAQIQTYIAQGQRLEGDFVTPTFVTIAQIDGDDAKTFMSTDTKATKVVDANGATIRQIAPNKANGSIFLKFTASGWQIEDFKVAA